MKTAPFDLELAKSGHPLITRGGYQVKQFIFLNNINKIFPIMCDVENYYSYDHTFLYTKNGFYNFSEQNSMYDLLMLIVPIKKSCWINIYKYGKVEGGFESEESANKHYSDSHDINMNPRTACIEIHWEE